MRSAAVTSELKSTCPGESIRLTCSVGQPKAQPRLQEYSCPAQGLMLQQVIEGLLCCLLELLNAEIIQPGSCAA